MSRRPSPAWAAILAVGSIASAAGVLYAYERGRTISPDPAAPLYLRSPQLASRLFLSFDMLAADVYWMRAVQHYGRARAAGGAPERFDRLTPLLDLATALDPHFNAAYRFGAILLSLEPPNGPGRPAEAIRLLERGFAANPGRWQYAHDIGFVHYWHTGRFDLAAEWFGRAAAMAGAPRWLGPLAAVTRARGGDHAGARALLTELLRSEQGYIRRAAERGLLQLQALDELSRLRTAIREYRSRTGRFPAALSDLRGAGSLHGAPADPAGHAYAYSPSDGTVALAADSPLRPLPHPLAP